MRGRAFAAAGLVAIVVVTFSLGQWQLRRAAEKQALQVALDAAARAAPVALAAATPVDAATLDGRRVTARGNFVGGSDVYVDNRSHQGQAGVHVITALRIGDGPLHVPVLRGWAPTDPRDRSRPPAVSTPDAPVEIEGVAIASPAQSLELGGAREPAPGQRLWTNFRLDAYARWSGLSLQPVLLRQSTPAAGVPDDGLVRAWPQPGTGVDKHHGYAFQWFAMSGLAATGALVWGWRAWRTRRATPRTEG